MAPLPDNNTYRLFVDYTSLGREHTIMVRYGTNLLTGEAQAAYDGLTDVLRLRMLDTDSFLRASYSLQGQTFSLPLSVAPVAGTITGANVVWENDPESAMLSFTGRSLTSGRDARWQFFTPVRTTTWPGDNRYNPGDEPVIDTLRINFRNFLLGDGISYPEASAIDRANTTFNSYVNISHNAYWQRKQRRGG